MSYYATTMQSEVEFLTSSKAEDVSSFLSSLSSPSQTLIGVDKELEHSSEAALVRLASFPELSSSPMLENDLAGNITYLNPAAVIQFPDIRAAKLQHPMLAGVVSAALNSKERFFIREVKVADKVFEQSVHYIPESELIRSYVVDISDRKQVEAALQQAHEELEIRVEERTAELSQANKQLRAEIIERQRAEEEVRFLQTITQAISESADFHLALGVVLRKVCDFTSWKYGEAWIPSSDGTALKYSPAWYGIGQSLEKFKQLSERFTFSPGTGLPGRVWSSRHPEWVRNVSTEPDTVFLRKQFVTEAGFKAGLGIPIIDNNQVLAVLVFFMFESCEEDKRLVEMISTVATQLGSLLQRKRAESALRQSEERYRSVVEQTSEGIFLIDADTKRILEANAAFQNLLGYTFEEIIGLTLYDIAALNRKSIDGNVQRVLREKHCFISEAQHRCKNGSLVTVEVNVNLILYGGREVFCVVTHDITERKRAEVALRESEERLNAILDNSTALIYVKDLQGRYILINAWYGILFHLDREEVKGKTDYDLFSKEIADVIRANDQKVLEARSPLDWEEVVPQDDGLHTYLSIKFPLYDAAGVPYAICGISTDITERKQVEVALRSSVATNRALLNAIPDLMFRISRDGICVNFKAAKDNNLPMSASEFLGKHLDEVLPTEVAQPTLNCVEKALSTGELQILESHLLVNDNLRDYEFRIAVSAEDEVMLIVRDITERKQAEADIRTALDKERELGELKSRFVTMASHEFRTPLATILSSTELLEHYSHKWSEEKKLNHFQRIQVAVNQMTGLLNDVLLIGKAEAGKLEFQPTPLDLAQFCRELVEEIQLTTSTHTIDFHTQAQCIHADMDEKLLRHILTNLLSNAIKYSPQGGTVHFDLVCEQEQAILRIQDEGIGIPAAEQAQLFNSFQRASNVGDILGTGLGLAIVKKSVDLHGGNIKVDSKVGVGTTFTTTLPLLSTVVINASFSSA